MEKPEQTREQLMTEIEILRAKIEKLKETQIKAEAARQNAYDEFERKVHEKTIQLNRINERLQAKLNKEKRTDTSLRESENYYRTIFENTGTATMIFDKDLKISMVNKKFEELSGYSEDECLGKTPFAFVVPEDLVKVQENYRLRKLDPDKAPPNYEVKCFDKQGTVKECIFSVSMVPNSDYIVASLLDVTAQHQAEEALKHRIDSQDLLLEISKYFTGMVVDDIDDMIKYTLRMIGKFDHDDRSFVFLLSNDETTVSNTHEWCAPSISTEMANLKDLPSDIFSGLMDKLRRFERTYISLAADLPLEAQAEREILQVLGIHSLLAVPMVCEDKLIGFLGSASVKLEKIWPDDNIAMLELVAQIFANSLQREQFARDLRDSESYYRTIFENTGAATMIIEADMTISRANREWERVMGYKKEELEGTQLTDIISDEMIDKMRKYHRLRRIDPTSVPLQYRTRLKDHQGKARDGLLYIDIIPGTAKSVATFIDLTDHNRIARALEAISAVNIEMIHTENEEDLLRRVCQKIVEVGGYSLAWVGYVQADQQQTVQPVAYAGEDNGYLAKLNIALQDSVRGYGPTGTAIRTGRPVVSRALNKDDTFRPWLKDASLRRFKSNMAIPFLADNKAFGALTIYSSETDRFDSDEEKLLIEMANDLAYAIRSLRNRTEKNQTAQELEKSLEKMKRILMQEVASLGTALSIRDPYTAGHQRRVVVLAVAIAEKMGLSKDQIEGISVVGNLHDIGKISVPIEILNRPGKLSNLELGLIKNHSQAGYEIVKDIEFPWPVAEVLLQHHERLNGSGYPQGLSGENILVEARIMAVADVVEAMSSHRPYRPALGIDSALAEISQNRGILFDPAAVDACLKLFQEQGFEME